MSTTFEVPHWNRGIATYGDIKNIWLTDDTAYPVVGSHNEALINRWAKTLCLPGL
jgi:hypothetical protein